MGQAYDGAIEDAYSRLRFTLDKSKGGCLGDGLLRQRRNLIVTCVLLWLMKYGGVTFSKFSLAGFDVVFKNPNALILSIWIAFTYFLYRYYQYFSDEGIAKLQQVFSAALEQRCEPIIRKLVKEKCLTNNDSIGYSYEALKRNRWQYQAHALGPYDPGSGSVSNDKFEIPIGRWQLRKGILLAVMGSIFRNSVVTDYLLPFVVACGVLYYCGINDWNGSFLRLYI
jgi:hypothetical protein